MKNEIFITYLRPIVNDSWMNYVTGKDDKIGYIWPRTRPMTSMLSNAICAS